MKTLSPKPVTLSLPTRYSDCSREEKGLQQKKGDFGIHKIGGHSTGFREGWKDMATDRLYRLCTPKISGSFYAHPRARLLQTRRAVGCRGLGV